MSGPTRRDALGLAGAVAALATAGRLPLLGAPAGLPVGLSPVQGFLRRHAPSGQASRGSSQEYAVLRWRATDPGTGETTNQEIGRLQLHVERQADQVVVNVMQTTRYSKPLNRLEAEIVCSPDPLLSLRSWKLDSTVEERDDGRYTISGRRDGDTVRIKDGMSERVFDVAGPLVSQWTLALATGGGPPPQTRCGLLEDLLLYKPDQRLVAEATVEVPFLDGSHQLRCCSQRGPAVLPVHYFADARGRTQLVTQGALAWALAESS